MLAVGSIGIILLGAVAAAVIVTFVVPGAIVAALTAASTDALPSPSFTDRARDRPLRS